MPKILLVEDDLSYSRIIKTFLEKNGFEVVSSNSVKLGLQAIGQENPELIIVDYRLPDGNGMELLEKSIGMPSAPPCLLITSYSDIRTAVKAMKMGACEYITKPINPDELLQTVKEALQPKPQALEKAPVLTADIIGYVVGVSRQSRQVDEHISIVAPTDLSVLILGETGTGKEYVARKIHQQSLRNTKPFVAVDCGALSPDLAASELFGHIKGSFTGAIDEKTGHFEYANGGTIFLDEVGNLPYDVQVKLLRAIQERKIRKIGGNTEIPLDFRIIAATNEDMKNGIQHGTFREDLFHRLNEFEVVLDPLRNRKEDIMQFAKYFLGQSNERLGKSVSGFDPDVVGIFEDYTWPGNLRELKNIVRRGVLLSKGIQFEKSSLPIELLENVVSKSGHEIDNPTFRIENQEADLIKKVLDESNNNKTMAAKLLGIDRKTLYHKLAKYNIG